VIELVRGVRITDYCDQNKVHTQERIKLFIQLCQAVQHAHQKVIIHRDLKPSTILVTLHDGLPVPKVIDFGIAKATVQPQAGKEVLGQVFGCLLVIAQPSHVCIQRTPIGATEFLQRVLGGGVRGLTRRNTTLQWVVVNQFPPPGEASVPFALCIPSAQAPTGLTGLG
jgi:serine/threonine protein kinase